MSIAASILAIATVAHGQLAQPDVRSPLTRIDHPAVVAGLRGSVAALNVEEDAWRTLAGLQVARIGGVPVGPNRTATLLMHRVEPMTADAQLVVSERAADGRIVERPIPRPAGQWWTGVVEGEPGSRAMLSRSAAGVLGFVQDSHGTGVIASDVPGGNGPVVSYVMGELPPGTVEGDPWICTELPAPDAPALDHRPRAVMAEPCRQLRVAVDTDNEFYAKFAAAPDPAAATTAYTATIYAGMLSIYQADLQILPAVNYLRLWPTATTDPWTTTTSSNALTEFRNYWLANGTSVTRDHVQMLSARSLGGGIAWTNAACGSYAYSVCGNMRGSFPYPLVSNNASNWDIIVTTHELGHGVGTTHTHNFCPTPADTCAPSGYYGTCQTAQTCIPNGTIMSYCHLCTGGTANIVLNFHPLCIASIASYMTASCNRTAAATAPVSVADAGSAMQGATVDLDPIANDQPLNCETLSLNTFDATSTKGGVLARVVGAGPGGRDLIRYRAPYAATGSDTFTYTARETSGAVTPATTFTVQLTPRTPGDLDGDGRVNGADLGTLLGNWGIGTGLADLNGDGRIDGADLGALLAAWTG